LEGKLPEKPGSYLMQALLSTATTPKAELRAEATARLMELGSVARPQLEAALKSATPKRKGFYQQLLNELGAQSAPKAEISGNLSKALQLAQMGEVREASLEVRAAWERSRDSRLLPILEKLGERVEQPTVSFKSDKEASAWWEGIARQKNPAELGWLLPSLVTYNHRETKMRIELLSEYPPDPRIADALCCFLEGDPFHMWDSVDAVYRTAITVLTEIKDPTSLSRVQALTERWLKRWKDMSKSAKQVFAGEPLARALDGLRVEPLSGTEQEALNGLASLQFRKQVSKEDLLQQVYAEPESDEPRLVLVDFLTERGDPRGEFIALQLAHAQGQSSPESRAQEQALLKEYGLAWAAEVPGMKPRYVTFRRGFPSIVSIYMANEQEDPVADPAWSTVEMLGFGLFTISSATIEKFLKHPHCRQLKGLLGLKALTVSGVYPHITTLGVQDIRHLPALAAFPSVNEFLIGFDAGGTSLGWADSHGIKTLKLRQPLPFLSTVLSFKAKSLEKGLGGWDRWLGVDNGAWKRWTFFKASGRDAYPSRA
jgi:uncharacterized protein (TIGR02996 family)